MERKEKIVSYVESSILLQPPNPMLSFNELNESPVLMPVALVSNEDVPNSTSNQISRSNTMDLSSKSSASASAPLSQLEQPLLVRKTPLYPASHKPLSPPSTSSSNLHADVFPVDTLSSPIYHPPSDGSSTGAHLDESNIVGRDWQGDHSIHPPGISNLIYHDNTRSYTEFSFMESSSDGLPRVFPDDRVTGVPSSLSSYNTCNFDLLLAINPHWLFQDTVENKEVWYGFSEVDNGYLESAFQKGSQNIVPTDGGRYDVFIDARIKKSVYFDAKDLVVRRSTWFYQISSSSRYKPFAEKVAETLEKHYCHCYTSKQWQRRFNIPGIGSFSFENPEVMFQFRDDLEVWPVLPDSKASPIVIKRGLPDGFEILPSEHNNIDHLVFIVQGIGSFCDLRFRTVSQCVDGFRDIANKLIASHFQSEVEAGNVGRIEFLPVAWHSKLHTSDVGLDRRMQNITLPSIPKLRHFTNDTLLDILLYSTPTYCQSILDTVASELNKMYQLFLDRNPAFNGKVFVAGHSLGSLILFDILANQLDNEPKASCFDFDHTYADVQSLFKHLGLEDYIGTFSEKDITIEALYQFSEEDLINQGFSSDACKKLLSYLHQKKDESENIDFPSNSAIIEQDLAQSEMTNPNDVIFPTGKPNNGMSLIDYPRLQFSPAGFFALGSPIAMFLSVRGYHRIKEDYTFPTCPALYHIFHPYDPVAFRIEPLIDPAFSKNPVLIPHHKGRKRLHLEIRENVAKFASEIKQKVTETMRFTWNSLNEFAKTYSFPNAMVTEEVDKILEFKMSESDETENLEISNEDIKIGRLNGGRRIDYVLQEKPIEALNDYVFALTSHATYWDSEDTVLLILKEIYAMQGIIISAYQTDSKVPADNMATQFQVPANNNLLQSLSSHSPYKDMNEQMLNVNLTINKSNEATATTTIPLNHHAQPVVNYTIPSAQPVVNYSLSSTQPVVDYSLQSTQPVVDCSLQSTQPVVDYSLQSTQPVVDYSNPSTQPIVDYSNSSVSSPALGPTESIGPPPLSGFVKRSPFMH